MTSPSAATIQHVHSAFVHHNHGVKPTTDVVVANAVRNAHPDLHMSITQTQTTQILNFVKAEGGVVKSLDIDNSATHRQRRFVVPNSREEDGKVEEEDYFAAYSVNWNNKDYVVYLIQWVRSLRANTLLTYVLGETPQDVDEIILASGEWSRLAHKEVLMYDQQMWRKNEDLYNSIQKASWDDVVLPPATKEALRVDVEGFFASKEVYKSLGVPWKRGVIFHGTPGNGKTISIKALMSTLQKHPDNINLLYVKTFEGCKAKEVSIREVFTKARSVAPCLLIFEDIDSMVVDGVRSYFLNEVDGIESNDGILMVGSTNHLDRLDPSIVKRPSRFDRKYFFPLPEKKDRASYCAYWRNKLASNKAIDFPEILDEAIAEITEGFSFAYLKEAFVGVLLLIAHGRGDGEDSGSEADFVSVTAGASDDESKAEEEKAEKLAMEATKLNEDELNKYQLWRVMRRQVAILKAEMGSEDAAKSD